MDFTLRQLNVFDAVARHNSVSAAADEVHLTQPAVSMAIQQLEHQLGVQLFIRAKKRISLTNAGRTLQPLVKTLLADAGQIASALTNAVSTEKLLVGASPAVGEHILDEICASFMARYPSLQLDVKVMPSFDVIEHVENMRMDIGLIDFSTIRPTLEKRPWFKSDLAIFCCKDHPLTKLKSLTAADLEGQKWCLQHRFADSRRQFMLAMMNHVQDISVILQSESFSVIKTAVSRNIGLSCLPRPCVARELSDGRLHELKVPDLEPNLQLTFNILTRKELKISASHLSFIETAAAML